MGNTTRRQFLRNVALGAGALAGGLTLEPLRVLASRAGLSSLDLAPGVAEFIADTYLFHAADFPDPNETVDALRLYLDGNNLLWRADDLNGAIAIFKQAIKAYPNQRHSHAGLGCALWHRYEHSGAQADLRSAALHLARAADMAMDHGKVRYTDLLTEVLPKAGEQGLFERLFERAFDLSSRPTVGNRPFLVSLDYARGLRAFGDARAEGFFQQAMSQRPDGHIDPLTGYAEWLIDQGRYEETVALIDADEHKEYPHFLRGFALERMGQHGAARAEYEHFHSFSAMFPAAARYRIAGSRAQEGVHFEDEVGALTHCTGHSRLAIMIYCEARGENEGGQRLCGWTARRRVSRGTVSGCISVDNSGSGVCEKYNSVLTQPYQFYLGCGTSSDQTRHVSTDIWYGRAPDYMAGNRCPGGCAPSSGNNCSGTLRHCNCDDTIGAFSESPMFFDLGCSGGGCKHNHGTLCGNDSVGNDHCFYAVHA
ncbi:MAG TPA: twin-arginine translocation signal domain-containing protein [Herpetosiphonaceae bacterium]